MTIACAWCKREMGEKCPDCGVTTRLLAQLVRIAFCENASCDTWFFLRERGGRTDSICDECLAALVAAPDREATHV
jgi:hypothetical protein